MFPSPASQSGDPEEGAPQSGGRRRIVPFVAKRTEAPRPTPRAGAKEPKASKPPRAVAAPVSSAPEDLPQTLVPLPRRPGGLGAAAAEAVPAAAKKSAPPKKDAFIRSFPADVRASEVQAAAAAKGLVITVGYVHWVRSRAKAAQNAQDLRLAKKRAKTAPVAKASKGTASVSRAKTPAAANAKSAASVLDRAADPRIAQAITTAAIASARMPNREASERLIIEKTARWVGFDRAIELLRTAQTRVDLLLRPLRRRGCRFERRPPPVNGCDRADGSHPTFPYRGDRSFLDASRHGSPDTVAVARASVKEAERRGKSRHRGEFCCAVCRGRGQLAREIRRTRVKDSGALGVLPP